MGEVIAMGATDIRKDIDELMQACDKIEPYVGGCTNCPLLYNCLREESTEDFWSNVSESRIEDFLQFADEIDEPDITDEDRIAFNADMSRQDDWVYREE